MIDAAETALFQAKVPASEPKYLVVDAANLLAAAPDSALQRIPDGAAMPGCAAIIDGTVGKIKDFYVFRSQFVPKTGSAPVTTHNMAFARKRSAW